jgi:hypothetical protein
MDDVTREAQADSDGTDRSAIIMMLTYVEAECRRLGDEEAARHAAIAASLINGQLSAPAPEPCLPRRLPVAAPLN